MKDNDASLINMEPRVGVGPTTCRFLYQYHVVGFTRLSPHHVSRFSTVFGRFCSEVVHKFVDGS